MTVNTHLTNLASNLVLSNTEKKSIATSIATLSKRLDSHFGSSVKEHFQFGSNSRGTILPRKADSNSDIDYMVVFDSSDKKKPQTYLDRLRTFAKKYYSTSEIYQSSPTIILSLNHIRFELAPAIKSWGCYYIPSPASSWSEWMDTDPASANKALTDKNNNENYYIKPLVRLIKYWNAEQGHPFDSFFLEQYIVGKFYWSCTSLKDYFYAFWEGYDCSYNTAQYIKNKVKIAKQRTEKAKEYEKKDMPLSAEAEIKKIVPSL